LQAVIAILAALHGRETTGQGQYIDVAMAATLLAVNERAHVICRMRISGRSLQCSAPRLLVLHGSQGEHFTVAPALSEVERFRPGCARCGASI